MTDELDERLPGWGLGNGATWAILPDLLRVPDKCEIITLCANSPIVAGVPARSGYVSIHGVKRLRRGRPSDSVNLVIRSKSEAFGIAGALLHAAGNLEHWQDLRSRVGLRRHVFVEALLSFDPSHRNCRCRTLCGPLREAASQLHLVMSSPEGLSSSIRFRYRGPDLVDLSASVVLLDLLCDLAIDFAVGRVEGIEAAIKVVREQDPALLPRSWRHKVKDLLEMLESGVGFERQLPDIRARIRDVLNRLSTEAIPDSYLFAFQEDQVAGYLMEDVDLEADTSQVMQGMIDECRQLGIEAPLVPSHVVPRLRYTGWPACFETEGTGIGAIAGYSLVEVPHGDEALKGQLGRYFLDHLPDFFASGGRSNGYSDMWGFACRGGGLFVSVQLNLGGIRGQEDWQANPTAASTVKSFNDLLSPEMDRGQRDVKVAVIFSQYRRDALILLKDTSRTPVMMKKRRWRLPPGWGCVIDLSGNRFSRTDYERLADEYSDVSLVLVALDFLFAVIGERRQ